MTIGILGAGQLGRMLALAGVPHGHGFRFLDPAQDPPAAAVGHHIRADYTDPAGLGEFARGLDVVTFEFENVPVEAVEALAQRVPIFPPAPALRIGQDRLLEKTLFRELGLSVHPFAAADSDEGVSAAIDTVGLPAIAKTRRLGYDGKGQKVLRTRADAASAWRDLGERPLLIESLVPFRAEVSVLGVRGRDGAMCVYPLVENVHRGGILHTSIAPAPVATPAMQALAAGHVQRLMERLNYVGVLAVEFFVVGDDLLANEMAPRVHNSGHWTIEGSVTSQFENHLRAVCGLPLGDPSPRGHSLMLNLVGYAPDATVWLGTPGAHLHLYGKAARPGRKVGHVTLVNASPWMHADITALEQRVPRS
ncbi:MAG: 5-(carboxyamino)imidazole ribonucleotide synthase [Phycisphaerae bacterium]|nr:5-(carboxyamino)imidazole ribonucleotide synthase [Phycisphaerae bacterium]